MTDPFFPFILRCDREKGYSASEFYKLFMATKPKGLTWYGYDVIVQSANHVEFKIFDMEDAVYGGIGGETGRCTAEAPPDVMRRCLVRRATELAAQRRRHELQRQEDEIVATYANELLTKHSAMA